jgi:hypothetical protein
MMLLSMSSCIPAGGGHSDSFCLVSRPILVSDRDVLTAETERQVLEFNETGSRICGWK